MCRVQGRTGGKYLALLLRKARPGLALEIARALSFHTETRRARDPLTIMAIEKIAVFRLIDHHEVRRIGQRNDIGLPHGHRARALPVAFP